MRILCLHGLGTNSEIFKSQLEPIRRSLTSAEFVFVEALEECSGDAELVRYFPGPYFRHWDEKSADTQVVQEACEYIQDAIDEEGPFDGVIGFSQGAAVAASVMSYMQARHLAIPWRFAIFLNGTTPLDPDGQTAPSQMASRVTTPLPYALPTVHVIGLQDRRQDESLQLYELADQQYARKINYACGHWIPKDKIFTAKMQSLIEWADITSAAGG